MTQGAYKTTTITGIIPAWNEIFSAANVDEGSWSRTANSNGIVVAGPSVPLDQVDALLDAIVLLHPSRFIVVYERPGDASMVAEVSARCQGVSATEHVCAEIVRLGVSLRDVPALPSVIRSLLLTGMSTDLYLVGGDVSAMLREIGVGLSDSIFIDSAEHQSLLGAVKNVSESGVSVVDLQWLRMSPWREALKELFTRPAFVPFLGALRSIRVETSKNSWSSGALYVGWLAKMLRLDVRSFGAQGYEAITSPAAGSKSVRIEVLDRAPPGGRGISRLALEGEGWTVQVSRGTPGLLECEVKVGKDTVFKGTRPCEDEDAHAVLRRYFAIGESVRNYHVSLQVAAELERLQRSFAIRA